MSGLTKFGTNKFGITNKEGAIVTPEYLSRYIQCQCRKADGYDCSPDQRTVLFRYFMSDEFLARCAARHLTACQVGYEAAIDPKWIEAGCSPQYSDSQKREIARRKTGVVTTPATAEGRAMLEEARKIEAERKEKAEREARYESLRTMDQKQLKQLLKTVTVGLPAQYAEPIEQLKKDYADMMASVSK